MGSDYSFAENLDQFDRDPLNSVAELQAVLAKGIEEQQNWGPRGTLLEAARAVASPTHEHMLIRRLQELVGEPLDYLIAVLGTLGGWASAKAIYHRYVADLESFGSDDVRAQYLQCLGRLGGPESVTGLMLAVIREDDEMAEGAAWQLHELGSEGSIDELSAQTSVGPHFLHHVVGSCKWHELAIHVNRDHVGGLERLYRYLRLYSGDSDSIRSDVPSAWEWFRTSVHHSEFLRQTQVVDNFLDEAGRMPPRRMIRFPQTRLEILGKIPVEGRFDRSVRHPHHFSDPEIHRTSTGGMLLLTLGQPLPLTAEYLKNEYARIVEIFRSKSLKYVVVNFLHTSFVDSQSIGELVRIRSLVTAVDGRMILCELPPEASQLLLILFSHRFFETSDSYSQAIELLGGLESY